MSKIIPQESIDVLRDYVNVSLDAYGIDCDLFIPHNIEEVNPLDVYAKPADYEHYQYTTQVFIVWSPNTKQLKQLGVFSENELPIVGYFKNKATNTNNVEVDVDITIRSYIKIEPQFIPAKYIGVEYFEVVDTLIANMHDAVIVKVYKLAPRRVA